MHAAPVLMILLWLIAVPGTFQQEQPADKPPQKGDRVVVRGCLSGPMLESTEMSAAESTRTFPTAVAFRLTGDKKLLKQMRKTEDGKVLEITGVLKSELPQGDTRLGTQIGKTRIVVGAESPHSTLSRGAPPMPVLEVKSYEPLVASCGG